MQGPVRAGGYLLHERLLLSLATLWCRALSYPSGHHLGEEWGRKEKPGRLSFMRKKSNQPTLETFISEENIIMS